MVITMLEDIDILKNKETIIDLLRSTKRNGADPLINWLESVGFFMAPSSIRYHGSYTGALAQHSLLVYQSFDRKLKDHTDLNVPKDSAIISGLCHDLCKADRYVPRYDDGADSKDRKIIGWRYHDPLPLGHAPKSIYHTQRFITDLTPQEAMLIRWHMGPYDPTWKTEGEQALRAYPEIKLLHEADNEVAKILGV
jgi:hypothetical protein